jgi:hypothetical protein
MIVQLEAQLLMARLLEIQAHLPRLGKQDLMVSVYHSEGLPRQGRRQP